jgi:hypothetical protein
MVLGLAWSEFREWGSFALTAATLLFVAYDIRSVRRVRIRADLRTYHNTDRLDARVVNLGMGTTSITEVLIERPNGKASAWDPGTDVLPASLPGMSSIEWRIGTEHVGGTADARLVIRTTAGDWAFDIPEPGAPLRGAKGVHWS